MHDREHIHPHAPLSRELPVGVSRQNQGDPVAGRGSSARGAVTGVPGGLARRAREKSLLSSSYKLAGKSPYQVGAVLAGFAFQVIINSKKD